MGAIKNRIGERYTTNEGYEVEIIEYFGIHNCTIQIKDSHDTILKEISYWNLRKGNIKNPNNKSVFNIGYFGQGNYKAQINGKMTKIYITWKGMLERCYDEKSLEKHPSYKGVIVCEEWHNFQNFAKWYEGNYVEGWHLDKDILVKENKLYSPETCCFVPREVNNLFTKKKSLKNKYPIGVTKKQNKFVARLNKAKKRLWFGNFNTPKEAFYKYKEEKEKYIKEIADKWRGQITEEVYQAMYGYQVEIDD